MTHDQKMPNEQEMEAAAVAYLRRRGMSEEQIVGDSAKRAEARKTISDVIKAFEEAKPVKPAEQTEQAPARKRNS